MVVSPVVSTISASSKTERELLDCSTVLCYLLAQRPWQLQVTSAIWVVSRQQSLPFPVSRQQSLLFPGLTALRSWKLS